MNTEIKAADAQGSGKKIGEVISASVLSGLEAKLELDSPEELKIGFPVIVEGGRFDFFCLVKDIVNQPLDLAERLAGMRYRDGVVPVQSHEGFGGRIFYSKADLRPIQLIDKSSGHLMEADTIPPYFSSVRLADRSDVARIYERDKNKQTASLGTLRGLPGFGIGIDFNKLTEKPFGIFGRTGAGKSILNKLVCTGIIGMDVARVLVFDMQDEYGTYSKGDGTPGLKHFFPEKTEVFTLDKANREAHQFILSEHEIEPADLIVCLRDLTDGMVGTLYEIDRRRDKKKIGLLASISSARVDDFPEGTVHEASLHGLQRKASRVSRFEFIKPVEQKKDAFNSIMDCIRGGKSVVLQFGDLGTDQSAYLFVANIITRRLFELYTEKGRTLPRLVVFLEEAHKFLSPGIADHTVFPRLARETRKFNLILAMVDQRPSQIDDEVRSQLANRLVLSLKEESDVMSALAGVPDRSVYEKIISSMPVRCVLVAGDAIRIPTVIDVLDFKDETAVRRELGGITDDSGGPKPLTKTDMDTLEKSAKKLF